MISSSVCSLQAFVRLPGLSCEHKFQLLTQPPTPPQDRHETLLGAHLHAEPMSGQKCESTRTLMLRPVEEACCSVSLSLLCFSSPLSYDHLSVSALSEADAVMMGKRAPSSKPPHVCVCVCVCAGACVCICNCKPSSV